MLGYSFPQKDISHNLQRSGDDDDGMISRFGHALLAKGSVSTGLDVTTLRFTSGLVRVA